MFILLNTCTVFCGPSGLAASDLGVDEDNQAWSWETCYWERGGSAYRASVLAMGSAAVDPQGLPRPHPGQI